MGEGQLSVELQAKIKDFINGMRSAANETQRTEGKITKSVNAISNAVTSKLSGVFSAAAVISFGKAVLDVTAEFQKFNAVLSNTLGSTTLASMKMKEIQDFAAKTPFGVQELTASFVKLANAGFKPTGEQMRALGDLASSTGKSFDQLAEAILDAQTGEFERLKEFGVRAKDAGDSVIFTYKGVQTQVEKTSGSIRDYITNLGNAEGVSGSMAKVSETLGGQISNLGDSWDQMLLSVGNNTQGVFNSAISVIGKAIQKITQYNDELATAEKYGLGGDFGNQLNRALNPFASKGATDIELAAYEIKLAGKNVADLVSKTTAGAKSVADFGKALAELKKQGDAALIAPTVGKKGEELTEKTRAAIKDQYQEGVKALTDARTAFANAVNNDANFGTAKKGIKSVADILKELEIALKVVEVQFDKSFSEKADDKIKAIQNAVDGLTKIGLKPASDEVKKLGAAIDDLRQLSGGTRSSVEVEPNKLAPGLDLSGNNAGMVGFGKRIEKEKDKILSDQEKFNEKLNSLISSGLTEGLTNLGTSLGDALANGGNILEAAGQSILSSIGGILIELGKLAIETGIGIAAVKAALKSLNPAVAIAAGVTLIAIGSAFRSRASALAKNGNQPESSGPKSIPRFATGVSNFKGGLALVGEMGPELINLPTGSSVIPNGRSEKMIARAGGGDVVLNGNFDVSLEKLYFALQRTGKKLGRLG